jgi:uncharacterized damage-inducible protein DinB
MTSTTIRRAYSMWPQYNRRLREVIAGMTDEQLAIRPAPDLLPIWATVGHTAAMRVYWICAVIGEPGADTTPFPDGMTDWADDLDHPRHADELANALDSTFRIIEGCLDRWTIDMLEEELRRPEWDGSWVHTRGWVIQRVFSHDVYHCAELNDAFSTSGLPQIDLWE